MDNEKKRQELTMEKQVHEAGYNILITASIYNFDEVEFAEKILQFVKEKQEKST